MKRNRHINLVPANDLTHHASVFNRDQLMNHTQVTEHERRAAARYLTRNGQEGLIEMILGGDAA